MKLRKYCVYSRQNMAKCMFAFVLTTLQNSATMARFSCSASAMHMECVHDFAFCTHAMPWWVKLNNQEIFFVIFCDCWQTCIIMQGFHKPSILTHNQLS